MAVQYNAFFSMCRLKSIHFDLQVQSGLTPNLGCSAQSTVWSVDAVVLPPKLPHLSVRTPSDALPTASAYCVLAAGKGGHRLLASRLVLCRSAARRTSRTHPPLHKCMPCSPQIAPPPASLGCAVVHAITVRAPRDPPEPTTRHSTGCALVGPASIPPRPRSVRLIGLLCIGRSPLAALKMATEALDFIHMQLNSKPSAHDRVLQEGLFRDACTAVRHAVEVLGGGKRKKREPLIPETPALEEPP